MTYTDNPSKYTDTRLEAVVVCQNYSDFLEETLPYNLPHVDRLVVVTSHDDEQTRGVCQKWSVECIVSDLFSEGGRSFGKGPAINIGLGSLRCTGWLLQLDADIVLPLTFRNMLDKSALRRDHIYGCERFNVTSYHKWQHIKANYHSNPQFGYRCLISTPEDTPVGANLVHKQYGYCPIGFFQLWHSEYMQKYDLRYPETHGSAEQEDVMWSLRWPRSQRTLLPTVRVFHLESERAAMGVNWRGRKTKPFTKDGLPPAPAQSGGYGY